MLFKKSKPPKYDHTAHRELEAELLAEDPFKYAEVIENLHNLEYSSLVPAKFKHPKRQMIKDFKRLGRKDIVKRIKRGEFDQ